MLLNVFILLYVSWIAIEWLRLQRRKEQPAKTEKGMVEPDLERADKQLYSELAEYIEKYRESLMESKVHSAISASNNTVQNKAIEKHLSLVSVNDKEKIRKIG